MPQPEYAPTIRDIVNGALATEDRIINIYTRAQDEVWNRTIEDHSDLPIDAQRLRANDMVMATYALFSNLHTQTSDDEGLQVLLPACRDERSGTQVMSCQVPDVLGSTVIYLALMPKSERKYDNDPLYETYVSRNTAFKRGESNLNGSIDPNYRRLGQIATFAFHTVGQARNPLDVIAETTSAHNVVKQIHDIAGLKLPAGYTDPYLKTPEGKASNA